MGSSEGEHSRPDPAHSRYAIGKVREGASNGVMDEVSGKVQIASTHNESLIVMDVAAVQLHVGALDKDSSALPNKEAKGHGKVIQRGDG